MQDVKAFLKAIGDFGMKEISLAPYHSVYYDYLLEAERRAASPDENDDDEVADVDEE